MNAPPVHLSKDFYLSVAPEPIEKAEKNPKQKLALILRWYFVQSNRLALKRIADQKVDFQIHHGPAMSVTSGSKGTRYEDWRSRHVAGVAQMYECCGFHIVSAFSGITGHYRRVLILK